MKVFISWSGERSKSLANAIKDWLPLILHYVEPWVSDKDISAGERWAQTIAGELETSNFGILCITPENLSSEWILFEAGALSKSMQDAKVIPLLFGLELSELTGPLSQFQALKVDEQGMLDAAKTINEVSDTKAADTVVEKLFPALWPDFQKRLEKIPAQKAAEKHMRPQKEILEDLVSQVRGLSGVVREFDGEHGDRMPRKWGKRFHPRMLDELMHIASDVGDDWSLVLMAGYLRDQMPWFSEVLIESHRELKTANRKQADEIRDRLMHVTKSVLHGPLAEILHGGSKARYMFAEELPYLLDRAISRRFDRMDTPNKKTKKPM